MSSNSKLKTQNSKLPKLPRLLLDWFSVSARDLPWRRTRDPYAIWVSEIMLQQTQVKTVIPYWERWMRELPTLQAVAKARSEKIHKLWEGLGYYTRVRNLQQAARQIVEQHHGRFPQHFEDVLALPGIGRYTAGAICSIAFNQAAPILDGNVIRVLTRIFGIADNPKEKQTNVRLWRLAGELVHYASRPTPHASRPLSRTRTRTMDEDDSAHSHFALRTSHFNQSLMELGALVCTPRQPKCPDCPVRKLCVAFREDRVGELPNPGKRTASTARHFLAFVAEWNGRHLVRQRPAGTVNAHLWEFPNVEILNGKPDPELAAKNILGVAPVMIEPLCAVKHSITRYRITLQAFRVQLKERKPTTTKPLKMGRRGTPPSETDVWLLPAQLNRLAFTSAHRKVLRSLETIPFKKTRQRRH